MSPAEKKLSSTVLEMKFMQRTKLKYEAREKKRKEAEARKECFGEADDAFSSQSSSSHDCQYSTDLTFLEGLKFGRMSFKGFNPEVEKLMVYYERQMLGYKSDSDSDDDKDIGDVEMASTLRGASMTITRQLDKTKNFEKLPRLSAELSETSSKERLNFTGVRKRSLDDKWGGEDVVGSKSLKKSS